jgi:glycosyltransferase involved in cell wall biosynthesis
MPATDRPPRLLITTGSTSTLTAFLLPYARHYRERGWRVDAATYQAPDCEACVEAFDHVHHVPWTRNPLDPVNMLRAPAVVRGLVREHGYDLVHSHDPIASFVTRYALRGLRRRSGLKVVYTAHGFYFYPGAPRARNLAFGTLERIASLWTDYLVVMNREDLEAARRFPLAADRVMTMPGIGVDLSHYDPARVSPEEVAAVRAELGLRPEQRMLLMAAEFTRRKRHADVVEALARCGREQVVLACAGRGALMDDVREQAERLGVSERVLYLGYRQDLPVLLRASFALVLPSDLEGLPRSVMEAACLERPVLASRIRGTRELVSDQTGVLFEVGDVEALAAGIRRLVDDPDAAEAMGVRGRQAMEAFDLAHLLELHDALYERVLADSTAKR